MKHASLRLFGLAGASALLLSGCASGRFTEALQQRAATGGPPAAVSPLARWTAPDHGEAAWPHEGQLSTLVDWWRQQGDPVVADFIAAAQAVSPSVSGALARRAQAQADRVAAGAGLGPQVDGTGSAQRRSASPPFPAGDTFQGGVQFAWELDVAGGLRAQRAASVWRVQAADAQWHEARTTVAADVALQVVSWRSCQQVRQRLHQEAESSRRTAEWMQHLGNAGLQPAATVASAQAAAAEARNRARSQDQRCEADVQALVQWTGLPDATVRQRLINGPQTLSWKQPRLALGLPAQVLAQRPDVFAAASAVAAAAGDVGGVEASRYPRVAINGFLGRSQIRTNDFQTSLNSWTIGPVSVSVPVWDGGRRAAATDAAVARYDDAVRQHAATVRRAVRETEEALQALATSTAQAQDAQTIRDAGALERQNTRRLAETGLATPLDAEAAERRWLAAEMAWLEWERQRAVAWIAVYRAAGGGWTAPDASRMTSNAKDTP